MPTKRKTKKPVKKLVTKSVRQRQSVKVEVNVNSKNRRSRNTSGRKTVAAKAPQFSSAPPLNSITQIPVPYNNSQFMQAHGIAPTPVHKPVKVPDETVPLVKELIAAPILPMIRPDLPEPMLHSIETTMTPLPPREIPKPRTPLSVKPQYFTPVKEERANLLLAEARRPSSPRILSASVIPRMNLGVDASTSIDRINLPQIREYLRKVLGWSELDANALKKKDKNSYIEQYGQAIQNYLNSLKE